MIIQDFLILMMLLERVLRKKLPGIYIMSGSVQTDDKMLK